MGKPGLIFNYRLMREFGNSRAVSAAKAWLLALGRRVFIYR